MSRILYWCFIVLQDRSFTFILKTPPASVLLAKAAGIPKGSGNPKTQKVGKISQAQLKVDFTTLIQSCNTSMSMTAAAFAPHCTKRLVCYLLSNIPKQSLRCKCMLSKAESLVQCLCKTVISDGMLSDSALSVLKPELATLAAKLEMQCYVVYVAGNCRDQIARSQLHEC